jgi:hypothetical protein
MIPDQKSVILLACTGHWWSCRIVTRDQVQGLTKSDGDDFFLQEDDDMELGDAGNDGAGTELNDENLQQLLKEESDAHMWPMDPAEEGAARLTIFSFESASSLEYQGRRKNREGDLRKNRTKGVSKPIQTNQQLFRCSCASPSVLRSGLSLLGHPCRIPPQINA